MKRNPQGAVDKRIRATLRPMSKNRRDSSVCELEQRLRDVKTNNCRFRKALLEKEAELQVKQKIYLFNFPHESIRMFYSLLGAYSKIGTRGTCMD